MVNELHTETDLTLKVQELTNNNNLNRGLFELSLRSIDSYVEKNRGLGEQITELTLLNESLSKKSELQNYTVGDLVGEVVNRLFKR